ncbi:hypothetical protein DMB95_05440 [Campylobacter sp. MIT 12-8780]|uniref:hypothetical protein n=1 Tax=unclassified Campylobacter TaxID=2593542 RepID=UPI00115D9068|nr:MULTISPECIES: hypothetical protein [unclassified Campylobacter]NDJ27545.1 hypothetical protein [Campylobacter sp. MIT 19-121]TQR41300.1 hypothetical protein DMB95_05440 [Campylobacter sp. MIT 12-8780]
MKYKKLFLIFFMLLFANAEDRCKSQEMQEAVKQIKAIFNPPTRIDPISTLIEVDCNNDTLEYKYTLDPVNDIKSPSTQQSMKKRIDERNQALYCENEFMSWYKYNDFGMSWSYYLDNKLIIFIKKTAKDCS